MSPPQSSSSFHTPVAWHPANPRPARGTALAVTLPDGGAIWTTVTGTVEDELTIALPPVLPAGTALELSWTDAPRVYRGTAVVLATTAPCLRLSLGSIRRVDRRGGKHGRAEDHHGEHCVQVASMHDRALLNGRSG